MKVPSPHLETGNRSTVSDTSFRAKQTAASALSRSPSQPVPVQPTIRGPVATHEIICPHCSKVFKINEAGYADILKQVRDGDFDKQLHKRLESAER